MTTLNCLECGSPIRGRADKKFCNTYCRNDFNNRKRQYDLIHIRELQSLVFHNYRILNELIGQKVSKEKLKKKGFSFKALTHHLDGSFYMMGVFDRHIRWEDNKQYGRVE